LEQSAPPRGSGAGDIELCLVKSPSQLQMELQMQMLIALQPLTLIVMCRWHVDAGMWAECGRNVGVGGSGRSAVTILILSGTDR